MKNPISFTVLLFTDKLVVETASDYAANTFGCSKRGSMMRLAEDEEMFSNSRATDIHLGTSNFKFVRLAL